MSRYISIGERATDFVFRTGRKLSFEVAVEHFSKFQIYIQVYNFFLLTAKYNEKQRKL